MGFLWGVGLSGRDGMYRGFEGQGCEGLRGRVVMHCMHSGFRSFGFELQ